MRSILLSYRDTAGQERYKVGPHYWSLHKSAEVTVPHLAVVPGMYTFLSGSLL
jgi:hypothetical protein